MDPIPDQKEPLVSVMLIVRNGGSYLAPQIDSILSQTYSNLELIICDDFSTDGTPQVAEEYMRRDPRVSYVRNETNLKVSLTFEKHCRRCRGEFIAPSDADDCWLPNKIEKQVAYLLAHPETQMVFADDMVVNEDLSVKMGSFQKKIGNRSRGGEISTFALLKRNLVAFHISCFRRTMLEKFLPMPQQSVITYDAWTALVCSLSAPLGFISEYLVLYRQHQSNMVGAGNRNAVFYIKRLNDSSFVLEYFKVKSNQLSVHERLLSMGGNQPAVRALKEKVAIERKLLTAMQAAAFGDFAVRMTKAAWAILKTNQKYHLCQWLFLAFSWDAIKKGGLYTASEKSN